jgi:hypothetical protein
VLKILRFFDVDPRSFRPWIRYGKIRIRDKHPTPAALTIFILNHSVKGSVRDPVRRIRMVLGLLDPDPLVRDTDSAPAPDPFLSS